MTVWGALNASRWLVFAVIVATAGTGLATAIDRLPPILAASIEGKTYAAVYHPGDLVSGRWSMKAVRVCNGTAERWLIIETASGPWVYRLSDVPVRLEDFKTTIPGRIEYPIIAFSLPADAPLGRASYFHIDHFVCERPGHWLFPINVIYQPLIFTVEGQR